MKAGILIAGFVLVLAGITYFLMPERTSERAEESTVESIVTTHEETPPAPTEHQGASIGEENLVEFACAEGKTITAVFARDILGLTLSDGRQMTLRQAESGSGIRYLNNTQTIEFRGKEDEAFLVEGGVETYAACSVQ
jgi:membrane-bound inhibitor of C-type lysozyme